MKIPETQEKQQANQARSDKKWNSTMASDARNKLIEELGDDIELIIAVQIEAAAKKAKAKEEKDFLNTLSALRAKISFPKFVSDEDKQNMAADRVMAWYLHINFPEYKLSIPKPKRAKSKNTAPTATAEQRQIILKMRDEGKTFLQVKEYFVNQSISIKGQSISMIMKPANAKKLKSNATAGALVASKALTPQERFLKET